MIFSYIKHIQTLYSILLMFIYPTYFLGNAEEAIVDNDKPSTISKNSTQ